MTKAQVEVVEDPLVGAWIKDSLYGWEWGEFLKLGATIPPVFDSYISIHNSKVGNSHGGMSAEVLIDLIEILSGTSPENRTCFFALWDGWSWGPGTPYVPIGEEPNDPQYAIHDFFITIPEQVFDMKKLEVPNRAYFLLKGELKETLNIGELHGDWFTPRPPNIIWPEDKNWCVASEIDFEVTLIGGSEKLINQIESSNKFITERFKPEQGNNEIFITSHNE
jgi:hypothetical protein